jgi:hypothetical protein
MNGEGASPAERAARIDLHHCFAVGRGVGGEACRSVRRRAPIAMERDAPQSEHQQWPGKQQCDEQKQPPGQARTGNRDRREFSHGKMNPSGSVQGARRAEKRDRHFLMPACARIDWYSILLALIP